MDPFVSLHPPQSAASSAYDPVVRRSGTEERATAAAPPPPQRAHGPLRVHPTNPRYFSDGTKGRDGSWKAVYLTGSHTWANLIDRGPGDPPPVFDYHGYLAFLQKHHHNFIRLWGRQVTWYHGYGEQVLHATPLPWTRSGPGLALDGKPQFDLTRFDPAYFDRLRARVRAARDRGIYVSIMLFGGSYECRGGWRGNPFHAHNNVNGIDGDPDRDGQGLEAHTLQAPAVTRLQEAYVRKVVDKVNDLDNVLYEISNEGDASSNEWQHHLIRLIHDYESAKPKRHPVGMTALYLEDADENNRVLSSSPAEWISPFTNARGLRDLPAADGRKVSLLDSDHWFVAELYRNPALGAEWVWKSFCRGYNPILMEHLPPRSFVQRAYPLTTNDPGYAASRTAMGQTRRYAERMNLSAMTPRPELASTRYCLANPGVEYLVYLPAGKTVTVDVSSVKGGIRVEWFDPARGTSNKAGTVPGGGRREFRSPFTGNAALYLVRSGGK